MTVDGGKSTALALLLVVALLVAGCASAALSDDPDAAQLTVVVTDVPDEIPTMYFEGSLRWVRVTGEVGTPLEWQTNETSVKALKLRPGRYELTAWERICSANCDPENLEPVTNRCALVVDLAAQATLRVTVKWTVPKPCVMTAEE